jgi:coenzyme F420-reducing hydrogenase delta subunit
VNAERRVNQTKRLLDAIGLQSERLRMVNISSAMGIQFAAIAEEMTAEIAKLGPNPLRENGVPPSGGDKDKEESARRRKQDGPSK